MSHFHSDAEIEYIARGLTDRSLPKPLWTHAAHFAAALWLLRCRGADAMIDMPPLIRAYNEATGVPPACGTRLARRPTRNAAPRGARGDAGDFPGPLRLASNLLVETRVVFRSRTKNVGRPGLRSAAFLTGGTSPQPCGGRRTFHLCGGGTGLPH
jgi:hypothetical protein